MKEFSGVSIYTRLFLIHKMRTIHRDRPPVKRLPSLSNRRSPGLLGQADPKGFGDAAGVVDEEGAGGDDGIPRAQHSQLSLGLGRAVMDGGEQGRVEVGQAGEGLSVGAIALAGVVVNASGLASIGDQDIVAQRECAPTFMATLQGWRVENLCWKEALVVGRRDYSTNLPFWSRIAAEECSSPRPIR